MDTNTKIKKIKDKGYDTVITHYRYVEASLTDYPIMEIIGNLYPMSDIKKIIAFSESMTPSLGIGIHPYGGLTTITVYDKGEVVVSEKAVCRKDDDFIRKRGSQIAVCRAYDKIFPKTK